MLPKTAGHKGWTSQSRLVRETDLNTIQGYIVKQEYPLFQQNPSLRHSFTIPDPGVIPCPRESRIFPDAHRAPVQ